MNDDSKRTQKLPSLPPDLASPRSSRRPMPLSTALEENPWENEEAATRDTDAAIPLPPVSPRAQNTRAVLTVVTGPSTGKVHSVEGVTIIGRGREAQLRLDDTGSSRAHAKITPTGRGVYVLEDLGSLNGTFVDGNRIHRAELRSGDRIHIGPNIAITFAVLDAQAERLAHQLYESSVRDPLTRAYNRRYLVERLSSELAYAQRHETPLGLILLDVDHFKRVNDTHGHMAGDDVLREIAALVQRLIRVEDVFARFGGEEFVVLVRGIEHANLGRFAERIRASVEKLEIAISPTEVLRVTVSGGYASLSDVLPKGAAGSEGATKRPLGKKETGSADYGAPDAEGPVATAADAMLRLADERLYHAKEGGRNRVSGA